MNLTATKSDADAARKLRAMADSLLPTIADKLRPMSQNPTPKRMREFNSRRLDGENLERARSALLILASAHESGTVPDCLLGVRSKSQVLDLVRHRCASSGYYDIHDTGEYADTSAQGKALQAMLEAGTSDDEKQLAAREVAIREKVSALVGCKIDGFFQTPAGLAAAMVQAANIEPGMTVLEPSAGIGNIAEAIPPGVALTCCEIRPAFVEILDLRGFKVCGGDFLEEKPDNFNPFDRVVMNPPFENGQDVAHLLHAWKFLKNGGRLVCIMCANVMYRTDQKFTAFRDFMVEVGAQVFDLPCGTFNAPGLITKTDVATVMVVIDKEGE